jgi:tetratricopeptide (TPR) repeat protein
LRSRRIELGLAACICVAVSGAFACGYYFPNSLLTSDTAIFIRPEANFERELVRMKLIQSNWRAVPATNTYVAQTVQLELVDLRACLVKRGESNVEAIAKSHALERAKIDSLQEDNESLRPTNSSRIHFNNQPSIVDGLPSEFAEYFRGTIAWHEQRIVDARTAWTRLLQANPVERQYKSAWAAYMLGKSWEDENRQKAIEYFRQVRAFANDGFIDSLGLAAASLGLEARLHWRDRRYAEAIDLYLEQAVAGDPTAVNSLRFAASQALEQGESTLRKLAKHSRAQRVVTAYVISGGYRKGPIDIDGPVKEPLLTLASKSSYLAPRVAAWHTMKQPVQLWLKAVEAAKVRDVESAEQLALAAYQAGEMETAQRWIKLGKVDSITAQWIQARLLLRDGNVDAAATILASITRRLPISLSDPSHVRPQGLHSSLGIYEEYYYREPSTGVAQQILAELGVLRVTRREFVQSLDTLLHAHFGIDADYVAECLLTLDELKNYVDRCWGASVNTEAIVNAQEAARLGAIRDHIREVLARRLTRANRLDEARSYYPSESLASFDQFRDALRNGYDSTRAPSQRAQSLWQAAQLLNKDGRILYARGTGPDGHFDWSIRHCGNPFDYGACVTNRLSVTNLALMPSLEEQERFLEHVPQPDLELEFRRVALSLAWAAAELMPDNSDELAFVLFSAGTWMKNRDAKIADRFYKALVRRCRRTATGSEADHKRWFPKEFTPSAPST